MPRNPDVLSGGRIVWWMFALWLFAVCRPGRRGGLAGGRGTAAFRAAAAVPDCAGHRTGGNERRPDAVVKWAIAPRPSWARSWPWPWPSWASTISEYRRVEAVCRQQIETMQPVGPASLVRELVAPPAGFADYLRRQALAGRPLGHGYVLTGWAAWLSWFIDGLLVLAGARWRWLFPPRGSRIATPVEVGIVRCVPVGWGWRWRCVWRRPAGEDR